VYANFKKILRIIVITIRWGRRVGVSVSIATCLLFCKKNIELKRVVDYGGGYLGSVVIYWIWKRVFDYWGG